MITGEDATYKSVTPRHPVDPASGHRGAFDVAARIGELRIVDGTVFDTSSPIRRSPRAAYGRPAPASTGSEQDASLRRRSGAHVVPARREDGDRPPETSIIGRAQTVFLRIGVLDPMTKRIALAS